MKMLDNYGGDPPVDVCLWWPNTHGQGKRLEMAHSSNMTIHERDLGYPLLRYDLASHLAPPAPQLAPPAPLLAAIARYHIAVPFAFVPVS